MPSWSSWVLTDQAAIDTCADALATAGYYNDVHRGHDMATPSNTVRSIEIHIPNDDMNPKSAVLGQIVVLMGDMLLVLSAQQYAESPFYEGP